jgi:diguanylate cyclase (GGDEF)-like protein/putative nucleotidyltransferase with HDIG domain
VAKEAAEYVGAGVGVVYRFDHGAQSVDGYWSSESGADDSLVPRIGPMIAAQIAADGTPAFMDGVVGAPILSPHGVWGAVLAAAAGPRALSADSATRLAGFLELAGIAITSAADRALLALGAPDPLTGLANRHTFDEYLVREVARARRHRYPLSLAVLDVDGLPGVIERHGHPAGDQALVWVARCLRDIAREDDLIARLGGDQFGWVLPYSSPEGAARAAERLRAAIAGRVDANLGAVTASIGLCDLARTQDPEQMLMLAQDARSGAKARGGNAVLMHQYRLPTPARGPEPTDEATVDASNTRQSAYALSRAVDVKDPSTHGHSRRVADLAGRLAEALGWTSARIRLLREAGLLYDVGKSGIPDGILLKSDALTSEEYDLMQTHATLGAQIVEDILTTEQVLWVRHHHERWDGRGYPAGLAGTLIPGGARILAVADSWDVMTTGRPYKTALSPEQALGECQRQAGSQFCPDVVRALGQLWHKGMLTVGMPRID